ncbi:hypothetical protein ACQUW5_03235 [Legionella sp. CNM-1927-20]|uniref:hypothetical protein n=1 Tax=Legionella sp. CNM-1927-20 TaxID=3422221 RepID=UPI00403AEFE2
MQVIFDKHIFINSRKIYCKVLAPTEHIEQNHYLLCISGGPGFGLISTDLFTRNLERQAKAQHVSLPNIILFDPLGCDKSDRAKDIVREYSMYNFTEIAAKVVEAVKEELCPHQAMNLRVYGGSFGSMTAMDIPAHRPQWLTDDTSIHLRQIISLVGPNGAGEKEYSRKYLERFKQHPNYDAIKLALDKLLHGKIEDKDDYIQNIVVNLAPLYSEENEKLLNSNLGRLIKNYYRQLIPLMKGVNYLANKMGLKLDKLDYMIMGLDGCSIEVLNQFFLTDMNGFNLTDNVRKNVSLYNRVPICLISCTQDHMVDCRTAEEINKVLPKSSAAIILNDKHMATKGPTKGILEKIIIGLLTNSIPEEALQSPQVNRHTVTVDFQQKIKLLNTNSQNESTKQLLTSLGTRPVASDQPATLGISHEIFQLQPRTIKAAKEELQSEIGLNLK